MFGIHKIFFIGAFSSILENRRARLYFFGVGLDPITTKPELLTCLVLNMDDVLRRVVRIPFINNFEGEIDVAELSSGQLEVMSHNPRTISTGAACMRLAGRHLSTLLRPFQ